MYKRVIPILLLMNSGLYKGVKFKNYKYVGDPINTIRIFNDKEVDELFLFDIRATNNGRIPDIELIKRIADECYMPFGVGGGIRTIDDIKSIIQAGAEKVSLNTSIINDLDLIKEASETFGSQSIVVTIDYKKGFFKKSFVYTHSGKKKYSIDPVEWAKTVEIMGAGEIIINSIDRDGTGNGLDLELIGRIANAVNLPVIASGGVGSYSDIMQGIAIEGVTAVGVGSFFVFNRSHRSVLINYPSNNELKKLFNI